MAHIQPLPASHSPELQEHFAVFEKILGFVPNSLLTMQRKPKMVKGFAALTESMMGPDSEVDLGFKRLLAHFASSAAGCRYCQAHSLVAARIHGISDAKLAELWSYQTSPLFSDAERAAMDFALAAGSVPNSVDATLMQRLKQHWSENQILEILGVISLYGFLNRWNDSLATELEDGPQQLATQMLADQHWDAGKHGKS
ncbi:MAG: carboxymuconolactone decarboxylase family protein [Gammaproteobacteria bacterium]|jgi:uncharacterized peroxidase-related enzyme|nr:carboxymuconolactone decarboxylase family protein [Gammaproteobacteria bacterium]